MKRFILLFALFLFSNPAAAKDKIDPCYEVYREAQARFSENQSLTSVVGDPAEACFFGPEDSYALATLQQFSVAFDDTRKGLKKIAKAFKKASQGSSGYTPIYVAGFGSVSASTQMIKTGPSTPGDENAQFMRGWFHLKGLIRDYDMRLARKWMGIAAKNGSFQAQTYLSFLDAKEAPTRWREQYPDARDLTAIEKALPEFIGEGSYIPEVEAVLTSLGFEALGPKLGYGPAHEVNGEKKQGWPVFYHTYARTVSDDPASFEREELWVRSGVSGPVRDYGSRVRNGLYDNLLGPWPERFQHFSNLKLKILLPFIMLSGPSIQGVEEAMPQVEAEKIFKGMVQPVTGAPCQEGDTCVLRLTFAQTENAVPTEFDSLEKMAMYEALLQVFKLEPIKQGIPWTFHWDFNDEGKFLGIIIE